MGKNLSLETEEPMIECGDWHPSAVSDDDIWLDMRFNPAGMKVVKELDAQAEFHNYFDHKVEAMGAMRNAGVVSLDLKHVDGLWKLHHWLMEEEAELGTDIHMLLPIVLVDLFYNGYTYSVKCKKDSPLVGWFLVLGGGKNG